MSDVSNFKVIREISADHEDADKKELNAYLAAGWKLVDIHQRDYTDPQTNQQTKISVYIVGHTDPQAAPPKLDDTPKP
ncbi:MAG: hypothetical protein ABI970_18295 [Chloroflexota bacterium]